MGVTSYGFNLNISPKMSYGVLEGDIVMLQNYMLMVLLIKKLVIKKERYLCHTLYICNTNTYETIYLEVSHILHTQHVPNFLLNLVLARFQSMISSPNCSNDKPERNPKHPSHLPHYLTRLVDSDK